MRGVNYLYMDDNAKHSGDRLRERAQALNLRPVDLARILEESSQTINAWFNRGVPMAKIDRIADALQTSSDWLRYGVSGMAIKSPRQPYKPAEPALTQAQTRDIPIIGAAQAGPDGYWQDEDYPPGAGNGFIRVPTSNPNTYALRIKGDSNAPALNNGWIVVIEPGGDIHPGEFVLVCSADGQCMIKVFLYHRNGEYTLGSINADYTQITLDEDAITRLEPVVLIAPPSRALV